MGWGSMRARTIPGEPGRKGDAAKTRWDLLPWAEVGEIADVFTFGARKYADHGYRTVEGARSRYFAALQRHLVAWWEGEACDPETGRSHLAHAGCCLLILMWHEGR